MHEDLASSALRRILLVDQDADLTGRFSSYLSSNGYAVRTAASGAGMDQVLHEEAVQLVVLEVALPGESGLSICRRLTQRKGPSVIFLSNMNDEADRIVGLELGADDYLAKPLSPRELLARVRAVLRRREPDSEPDPWGEVQEVAGYRLDPSRRRLRGPTGVIAPLTRSEFSLMTAFFDRPGRILTRLALIEMIGALDDANDRFIDTQVSRLRRKLNAHFDVELIRTVRGSGYIFDIGR